MAPFVLVYFRVNVLENANSKNVSLKTHVQTTHLDIYNIEVMLLTLF